MSDKSVETLAIKFDFLHLASIPPPHPFPQNNADFSIPYTAQTTAPVTQHIELGPGGIRELS